MTYSEHEREFTFAKNDADEFRVISVVLVVSCSGVKSFSERYWIASWTRRTETSPGGASIDEHIAALSAADAGLTPPPRNVESTDP